jgi:hypothetical protein
MNEYQIVLKNASINETIFFEIKGQKELFLVLSKKKFLEVLKIDSFQKFRPLSLSNFSRKIYRISVFPKYFNSILDLLLIDNHQTINLVKLNKFFEFKITSSINLAGKFFKNKFQGLFVLLLEKPFFFFLSTTCGLKILIKIGLDKKNNLKFLKKGIKVAQKKLICYFLTNSNNSSDKVFFSIESLVFLPYSRYLVCYKYTKRGKIRKNLFSQIHCTAYFIIPISNSNIPNKSLIILAKGKLTIIDGLRRYQFSESFPLKKFNGKYLQIFLISFCFFKGNSKTIFFFLNKEGDIFTFSLEKFFFNDKKKKALLNYFDSLPENPRNIKIFPGGIFYSDTKKEGFFLYRFIRINNSENYKKGFFIFRKKLKNLVLLDKMCHVSNLSSIVEDNITELSLDKLIFFCTTKNNSSLRFLHKIFYLNSIIKKSFISKPLGIFFVKKDIGAIYFFVSFNCSTLSFSFGKNIEEVNQFKILTDCKTVFMKYHESFKTVIQVSIRLLRFIKIGYGYKKICQWIPDENIFILDCIKNEYGKPYLFILLSNYKIVLIELTKNDLLLELKSWFIENFVQNSLLLNCYISNSNNSFKFLIIGSKLERMLRIFKIYQDFSVYLTSVQLLEWSPESISILKKETTIFFFIGLNNGVLLKSVFCSKKGEIKIVDFLNLSPFPLYFPKNFYLSNLFIFGEKVWKIKNNWWIVLKTIVLYNKSLDLVESLGNFLISSLDYKLKIILFTKKKRIKLNGLGFLTQFVVLDSCYLKKFKKKFILTLNRCKPCSLNSHFVNQFFVEINKNLVISFDRYKKQIYSSSIEILRFSENISEYNRKNLKHHKTFIFLNSSGKYFLKTILKKKASRKNKYVFLICKVFENNFFETKGLISPVHEDLNKTGSLMLFSVKNNFKFCSNSGGKYKQSLKLTFLYEKNMNSQILDFKNFFLNKSFFGSRILIGLQKKINLLEIGKDTIKIFKTINFSTLHLVKIQTIGNRIYLLEKFRGLKVFLFTKKTGIFEGINLLDNFLLKDFFILNPRTIILIDIFKNTFVFKMFGNYKKYILRKKFDVTRIRIFSKLKI